MPFVLLLQRVLLMFQGQSCFMLLVLVSYINYSYTNSLVASKAAKKDYGPPSPAKLVESMCIWVLRQNNLFIWLILYWIISSSFPKCVRGFVILQMVYHFTVTLFQQLCMRRGCFWPVCATWWLWELWLLCLILTNPWWFYNCYCQTTKLRQLWLFKLIMFLILQVAAIHWVNPG